MRPQGGSLEVGLEMKNQPLFWFAPLDVGFAVVACVALLTMKPGSGK